MHETLTSSSSGETRGRGRRAKVLSAAVVLLVLALVGWAVVAHRPAPRERAAETADTRATVHDVSSDRTDTASLVESVDAVVRGGEGSLRLRIRWVDDPEDASTGRAVPALSATVTTRSRTPG